MVVCARINRPFILSARLHLGLRVSPHQARHLVSAPRVVRESARARCQLNLERRRNLLQRQLRGARAPVQLVLLRQFPVQGGGGCGISSCVSRMLFGWIY